jgi:hypothetical protein
MTLNRHPCLLQMVHLEEEKARGIGMNQPNDRIHNNSMRVDSLIESDNEQQQDADDNLSPHLQAEPAEEEEAAEAVEEEPEEEPAREIVVRCHLTRTCACTNCASMFRCTRSWEGKIWRRKSSFRGLSAPQTPIM